MGDIVGSRFEFDNYKSTDFDLFGNDEIKRKPCRYTDDTVMTVAIADALMHLNENANEAEVFEEFKNKMRYYGRKHFNAGFGNRFIQWLLSDNPQPYNSFGNGSAMRVSPIGFYAKSLSSAERLAEISAKVTHNHPEGIKGARVISGAVWLGANSHGKEDVLSYARNEYPEIDALPISDLQKYYTYEISCQGTVPVCFAVLKESNSFEDAIRKAVSVGGDCDTVTCIVGGLAQALFGFDNSYKEKTLSYLDAEMRKICTDFGTFTLVY